jgi:hypothetical protein
VERLEHFCQQMAEVQADHHRDQDELTVEVKALRRDLLRLIAVLKGN